MRDAVALPRKPVRISSARLQFVAVEPAHARALLHDRGELAQALRVYLPESWPRFAKAFARLADPAYPSGDDPQDWGGYFFIDPAGGVLVGNGGFKGPPDEAGAVEIGYEIAPEYRNRGFASEAAQALIGFAFSQASVRAVIAHTLAERSASAHVLRKAGMRCLLALADPALDELWRWRIGAEEYRARFEAKNTAMALPFSSR
jgi:RimJ/RimL family protein N-acetyltransferase